MFTLLMAAISTKNRERCSGYEIEIRGAMKNLFIDEKDVEQLLQKNLGGGITGKLITSFNLHLLEMNGSMMLSFILIIRTCYMSGSGSGSLLPGYLQVLVVLIISIAHAGPLLCLTS